MPADQNHCDLLIVGSGIMGACTARLVRDARPTARILMLDAGPVLGPVPGQHLHDMPDGEMRLRYNERVSSGVQGFYAGATDVAADMGSQIAELDPGMYQLSSFGEECSAMPSAALAWNAGGMGIHWTAATPAAWGSEIPDFIDSHEWAQDMATASAVLHVNPDPLGAGALRTSLISALNDVFGEQSAPGREVKPLPMAINPDGEGGLIRSGPNRIFPPIASGDDPHFELRTSAQAVRLLHEARTVHGAVVRDVTSGEEYTVTAAATIVCADAFRTPQLLFASGIRPAALGRHLNEHIFQSGRVRVDLAAIGLDETMLAQERAEQQAGERLNTSYWLPHSDEPQPFNGQFTGSVQFAADGDIVDCSAGIALYVPTEIQASNRVEFSETELDAAGMPKMTISFDYTDEDRRLLKQAQQEQERAGRRLGRFDPETDSAALPPGTSLHMTGTVRMGAHNDGTSVCDPDARVWDHTNLYLAGCGVVPTALVGNSTLTGVVTAVRAARAVVEDLSVG
ncbi:GMC oxidoreductase [Streptomyces sp. NPDC058286]|uniref:GMC oxidoreductase n=1 Tax=unclassified Streptomyces TaxID=2593676 RepID=UPI0036E46C20